LSGGIVLAVAATTDRESGLFGLETLWLYLETKSVIVSTDSRPTNPFGL